MDTMPQRVRRRIGARASADIAAHEPGEAPKRGWLDRGIVVGCLAVAGCRPGGAPTSAVGTLEIVEVDVGPMQPARALRVLVREGDTVRAGDTLAVFVIPTLAANEAQAEARLRASRASARELSAGARSQELSRAESELRAAEADAVRSATDLARLEPLAAKGDVSKSALDMATAAARSSAARRDAAKAELALLKAGTRDERRQAADADVRGAVAASAALRATANDLVLLAPTDGVVLSRNAEPGEVLAVGASAITLGQPSRPWARIFVSQFVLPTLKLGDTLVARLDGDSTAYRGRVAAIASKAEFTPRVALTDQERADLLFGVKIEFDDRTQRLKAGLPITVALPISTATRAPQ
jgi:HlyD family secretion protein